MWLATQYGFYSIVQKPAGRFHVRTRCEMDLKNIVSLAGIDAPIHHTETGDYAWRIVVGQSEVNAIMAALAASIGYPTRCLNDVPLMRLHPDARRLIEEVEKLSGRMKEDPDGLPQAPNRPGAREDGSSDPCFREEWRE